RAAESWYGIVSVLHPTATLNFSVCERYRAMAGTGDWEFPEAVQPKAAEVAFDLDRTLASVLSLRSKVPDDAFTASILGTERSGNGVVIGGDGLVLTIGYLITEAEAVWLTSEAGTATPAHVVGYDQVTGFGLVQALSRLGVPAMALGTSRDAKIGDQVIVAGHRGRRHARKARVVSKREFAGYWEYVLDEAIFTAPPHPSWGGAALVGWDGRLQGIGSLFIQATPRDRTADDNNMFVPIDLLEPILDDLLKFGKVNKPPRPWLGMYTTEAEERVVVAGLARGAPADRADLQVGDVVLEVAGVPVANLADTFRKIWALGPAGTEIPLTISRDGEEMNVRVRSADRNAFLKSPRLH
ncbi:MAG: S1C family serine protease, partial [Kiloniellaceae bacterium]